LFSALAFLSCKKSNDSPKAEATSMPVPDSVVLSYPDGGQWKTAYTYHLEYDAPNHVYTVEETDQTLAPLPLVKTRKKFYLSPDGKQLVRIVTQQYSLFGSTAIPVTSLSLDLLPGTDPWAPQSIKIQGYQDIDAAIPAGTTYSFPIEQPFLAPPFDVRTRTRIPILPTGNDINEYLLQYREDSLLAIQGDFDLKRSYFDTIAPGYQGQDAYFNSFVFSGDSLCHQFSFDKTWQDFVWVGGQGGYVYHPVARKKVDFHYDSHSRALAAIFNSIDPGWFSPYKTMVNEYTVDIAAPQKSTRTFFENISSTYTDSLFTFTPAGEKLFYSATSYENTISTDSKNRITSLQKKPSPATGQAVRYTFFYKD
jgi:hypothetical protein